MQVVASKIGFYGVLRQPGEVFEVPDTEPKSSWFAPAPKPEPTKGAKSAKGAKPEDDLA